MKNRGRKEKILSRKFRPMMGLLCLSCLLMSAVGCGNVKEEVKKTERELFAMDTFMKLTFYGEKGAVAMEEAVQKIHRLEGLFSVTRPESDIAQINAASGSAVEVQPETYELLRACKAFGDQTGGLLDISIYPIVKLWGFTTEQYHVPDTSECRRTLKRVDYKKIELLKNHRVRIHRGMAIDLGAVAKGYVSQHIMAVCKKQGVTSAIVSLGGNVQAVGTKPDGTPFVVGITDPADGTCIYGTIQVRDKAVITSGIYQRNFEQDGVLYHHIMDKRTGMPAENDLASVTVVATEGDRADALATALYIMGEKEAKEYQKKHPDVQMILIRKDGTYWQSPEAGMKRE